METRIIIWNIYLAYNLIDFNHYYQLANVLVRCNWKNMLNNVLAAPHSRGEGTHMHPFNLEHLFSL